MKNSSYHSFFETILLFKGKNTMKNSSYHSFFETILLCCVKTFPVPQTTSLLHKNVSLPLSGGLGCDDYTSSIT